MSCTNFLSLPSIKDPDPNAGTTYKIANYGSAATFSLTVSIIFFCLIVIQFQWWNSNTLSAPCVCKQFVALISNFSQDGSLYNQQQISSNCVSSGISASGADIFIKSLSLLPGLFKITLQMYNKRISHLLI